MAGFIYTPMGKDGRGLPYFRPGAAVAPFPASVTDASATTSSAAVDAQMIVVFSLGASYMRISSDGTAATSNDFPIPAQTPSTFALYPGDYVSFIQDSGTQTVYVYTVSEV